MDLDVPQKDLHQGLTRRDKDGFDEETDRGQENNACRVLAVLRQRLGL